MRVFSKIFCCTWAVGCQKFVQYKRMLCPGRFILVESVKLCYKIRQIIRPVWCLKDGSSLTKKPHVFIRNSGFFERRQISLIADFRSSSWGYGHPNRNALTQKRYSYVADCKSGLMTNEEKKLRCILKQLIFLREGALRSAASTLNFLQLHLTALGKICTTLWVDNG